MALHYLNSILNDSAMLNKCALAATPSYTKKQQSCWQQWRLIVATLTTTLYHL